MEDIAKCAECVACKQVPRDADLVQCVQSHIICSYCAPKLKNGCPYRNKRTYTKCGAYVGLDNRNTTAMALRDDFVMLLCANAGCDVKMKKSAIVKHEEECEFKVTLVNCKNKEHGCTESFPESELAAHETECRYNIVHCVIAECDVGTIAKKLFEHTWQAHEGIDVLAGGGTHELFFGVSK